MLPVDWDEKFLITKLLQMVNKVNRYSHAITVINSIEICGTNQTRMYINFVRLYARLGVGK